MRISSSFALVLLFAAGLAWSVSAASCASIGSGCIRNSDCSSGQICLASTCQIDPGSIEPEEAGDAEASPLAESSALPSPIDSSDDAHEAAIPDPSVTVPSPDAKSSDVSSEAADAADVADAVDAADVPSESRPLDATTGD